MILQHLLLPGGWLVEFSFGFRLLLRVMREERILEDQGFHLLVLRSGGSYDLLGGVGGFHLHVACNRVVLISMGRSISITYG